MTQQGPCPAPQRRRDDRYEQHVDCADDAFRNQRYARSAVEQGHVEVISERSEAADFAEAIRPKMTQEQIDEAELWVQMRSKARKDAS